MRILLQRVSSARVAVAGSIIGDIGAGLLLYVGFGRGDSAEQLSRMSLKLLNLRVFPDERGYFDRSVLDITGDVLVIPQFTLYADTTRGRRPNFTHSLAPAPAEALFTDFVQLIGSRGSGCTASGRFGAAMQVESVNDGPVSLMLTDDG